MRLPAHSSIFLILGSIGIASAQEKPAAPYPEMAPIEQYRIADRAGRNRAGAQCRTAVDLRRTPKCSCSVASGYETAVKGKNGFVCFVERSWTAGFDDRRVLESQATRAELLQPASRAQRAAAIPRAHRVGAGRRYQAADDRENQGGSRQPRLQSPRGRRRFPSCCRRDGYLSDAVPGPWLPHVMFFVPHGQGGRLGRRARKARPSSGKTGSPFESTVLFIPVRRWSDGSPGPAAPDHRHN